MSRKKFRRASQHTTNRGSDHICWWCGDPYTVPGEARPVARVLRRLVVDDGGKPPIVMICITCAPDFDRRPRSPDDAGLGRPPGV